MKDGGPAFPDPTFAQLYKPEMPFNDDSRSPDHNPYMVGHGGMSMRDYFAAKAMPLVWELAIGRAKAEKTSLGFRASVAMMAYEVADAMLAERDKPTTEPRS